MEKDNKIDFGFTNDIDRGPAFLSSRFLDAKTAVMMLNPQNINANATFYDRKPEKYDPEKVDLELFNFLVECGNPVIMKITLK